MAEVDGLGGKKLNTDEIHNIKSIGWWGWNSE